MKKLQVYIYLPTKNERIRSLELQLHKYKVSIDQQDHQIANLKARIKQLELVKR